MKDVLAGRNNSDTLGNKYIVYEKKNPGLTKVLYILLRVTGQPKKQLNTIQICDGAKYFSLSLLAHIKSVKAFRDMSTVQYSHNNHSSTLGGGLYTVHFYYKGII